VELNLTAWLARTPALAYLVMYGIMTLEGAGVPGMPAAALFLATGVLAARGKLSLTVAVTAGAAGVLTGNLAGYLVGRRIGSPVLIWLSDRMGYRENGAERAAEFFRRYGGLTVAAARWFLPLRAPSLVMAGQTGLPLHLFLLYALPSAVAWVLAWQYGAFALARGTLRWTGLEHELEVATTLFGAAAMVLAVGWLGWVLLRQSSRPR